MIVTIVVAIAENNAIGKDNQLLWYLPTDLKHFKDITNHHTIIMGRKTFDSIGKPLPNRRNIVITRNTDLSIPGAEVTNTLDQALELCSKDDEVFIVGGAEIYRQALGKTDRIYLTRVHESYSADTFFPEIDPNVWKEISSEKHQPDEKNKVAYTFATLERK
ncbi:dihydrofolate reductase [Pedobacter metabolipauper]|uniref:Dihydrofolate reductase n=1 Tax=Pedobacter metabolipauper TaxID=425513 RepID=A0A4R6SRM7_9SPHI|nr:dihydrofolate reductase [Pedobacter metabolipauper]TDQ07030.1 dihydrofolate reductase [Pedobacter metabolipauper]